MDVEKILIFLSFGISEIATIKDLKKLSKDKEVSTLMLKDLEVEYVEVLSKMRDDREFYDYIITVSSICIALTNMTDSKSLSFKEFIEKIEKSNYPKHFKDSIKNLLKNPPTTVDALNTLKIVNSKKNKFILSIIKLLIYNNNKISKDEKEFLERFYYMAIEA